uniref:CHIP6 n=1 Tax=Ganoderma boninense TaxID=34458 RepID=A0A5K1JVG0_9APHY
MLPPGSPGAIRDISEAFRFIPLHPSQWPGVVVRTGDDEFDVDVCAMFGGRSCVGIYGSVADAGADIMRAHGIGPLIKWVDDHLFLRVLREHIPELNRKRADASARIKAVGGQHHRGGRLWYAGGLLPDGQAEEFVEDFQFAVRDLSANSSRPPADTQYSYAFQDVDSVSQRLGPLWEQEKDQPFSTTPEFTGLTWDLVTWQVALAQKKRDKYLAVLAEFRMRPTHTLQQIQSLHGKLIYTALVVPAGRPYLVQLESAMAVAADRPHVPRAPPKRLAADLDWWSDRLRRGPLSRRIPRPVPLFDARAFSDASSGVGVAVVIAGRWRAWRVLPGWQSPSEGRDIGWLEAVGFELLVYTILRLHPAVGHFKKPLSKPAGLDTSARIDFNDRSEVLGQSLAGDDIFWWDDLPEF